jgi:hypothetical protein
MNLIAKNTLQYNVTNNKHAVRLIVILLKVTFYEYISLHNILLLNIYF